jgi:hypothetical protein
MGVKSCVIVWLVLFMTYLSAYYATVRPFVPKSGIHLPPDNGTVQTKRFLAAIRRPSMLEGDGFLPPVLSFGDHRFSCPSRVRLRPNDPLRPYST